MTFIDSHSHLYLEEFSEDLPAVIERAKQAGVAYVLLPNVDSTTIEPMLGVCATYRNYCFPMMGLHPTSVESATYQKELALVEDCLKKEHNYIGIGEIGIDLYWDKTYIKEQLYVFEKQIQLALEYDLPIVVHTRDAYDEVCKVISIYKDTPLRGIFHSFTGTEKDALKLLDFERFMLGVNGVVTFKNSSLRDILREAVPLNRLVLETDAPYLTPVPYRGKRNESSYLQYVLHKVAEVYSVPLTEVAEQTKKNTLSVFGELAF
ncbi:TatD family deoxyribonuclease [Bacteroides sp. 214]|uniref:TatD family hydrolase n=1 Tax=Bacteroides sp. 214 TaxID=2302935 RepID=UPI0013D6B3BE|nr:TatD family hydrolase [Bacteroides sp. 214]NDW13405.1 TatD family deoxyribonuclease [Bacteroides sp. 214]